SLLYSAHHPDLHSFPTRRSSDLSARNECVILILLEYAVSDWIRDGRIVGSVNKLSRIVELVGLRIDNAGRSVYGILNYPELGIRSEEHTSELQSRENLVCRLLLE